MRGAHIGDKGKREDVMWRRYLVLMCGLGVTWGYLALAAGTDEIRVEGGLIAGTSANGVRAFKGIPFAAPPVGDLRWKPPQPVIPWSGVHDATRPPTPCIQHNEGWNSKDALGGKEDCLYLSV